MRTTTLSLLLLLSPLVSGAADGIKPFDAKLGLWETTSTMEMSGMPAMPAMPQIPEETLAKMPAAQRAQVEAMMKSRGGVGSPRTTTTKSCLTRESLNRALAFGNNEKSCTHNVTSSSPTRQEIHMECAQGKTTTKGDMTIERVDAEHVKGAMVMKSSESGRPMDMKMSFNTKWVSSDCGDVKPAGEK